MPFWSKREREVEERIEPLNEAPLAWAAANVAAARTALLRDARTAMARSCLWAISGIAVALLGVGLKSWLS
jgi:hypothetical protein